MKKSIIISFFSLLLSFAYGQETSLKIEHTGIFSTVQSAEFGEATIFEQEKLHAILKQHIIANDKDQSFEGWRVQVFFGSGKQARATGNSIVKDINNTHIDNRAYLVYDAPYFKVRVGDFRSRYEAMRFKKKIEKSYPDSWIVEDMINLPEVNK